MKLLHVDSSITGARSVSRVLSAAIVAHLERRIPGLEVVYRDVVASPIPHRSAEIQAKKEALDADANASASTPQKLVDDLRLVDAVLEEFIAADIVVLGAPMYNFGIPSQLKAWVDCIAVQGRTFRYDENGVEGLAGGKRLIVASSRGGFYGEGSPMAGLDHQEPFLAGMFGFLGVQDIQFVRAEGVALGPEQRQRSLDGALVAIAAL